MKKKLVKTALVLVVALLAAGWLACRNAARIAEWALGRAAPAATVKIGQLRVSLTGAEAGNVVVTGKDGVELARVGSVNVKFGAGRLLRRQVDAVAVDDVDLMVSQDAAGVWNFERLAGKSAGGANAGWQIGEFSVRRGQVVLGENLFAVGLTPASFDVTARNVGGVMTGSATARLPACDVQLRGHPIVLRGVAGELQLKIGGDVAGKGRVGVARVEYKGAVVESVAGDFDVSERAIVSTNAVARFYGSGATGFAALYLNARPVWFNAGIELKQVEMEKLTAAMVPDMFKVTGKSYLYLEAVGNVQEPVTWAKLQFKTESAGMVYVKDLPRLLAASSLPADKQQLFLLAFDRGQWLPYKSAWLNADVHARTLTVSTHFERQAKWFVGMEVAPPPFEIPVDVLRQKGWLP